MNMIGSVVGGAMGTVGGIFGSIAGMKADKKLGKLLEEDPTYKKSPYATERYQLAKTLLGSRMAGSATMERGIYGSAANAMGGAQRNFTDASQGLAFAAGLQGNAGDQFTKLGAMEGQDYMAKLGNLTGAQEGMNQEHKDMFDDEVRRWTDKVNVNQAQYAMRQAGAQSFSNFGNSQAANLNSMGGGGSGGGSGMGGMMSDKRLKHNYHVIGKSKSGINIYEFSYKGSDTRYQGVMADEILDAAFMTDSGYLAVDYSKTDVQFKQL